MQQTELTKNLAPPTERAQPLTGTC
jgi:hypothetical protein